MTLWEYRLVGLVEINATAAMMMNAFHPSRPEAMSAPATRETLHERVIRENTALLDAQGAEGWELVDVSGGIAWFKRARAA